MEDMIREHVEAQVQEKIAKGEALASAIAVASDLEERARAAAKEIATATRDALAAGWSENELKQLGLVKAGASRARKARGKVDGPAAASRRDNPMDATHE